ncbi:hypothetical protein HJC23_002474 [Cyclotella cryptica]|uniref:Vacuolar protein 14 C-terminal Fig4-binding domain-containing protein n=1 Tax=Cyclotella cryptica TaxID=29204 RepID=A0ABD3PDV6_9STRA
MSDTQIPRTDSTGDDSSLPALPSITESASVTEDERQRILAGILAEDEDDDDIIMSMAMLEGAAPPPQVIDGASNSTQLPQKVFATARKRIESENAFSSSSEDDDDEDTDLQGIYGQRREDVASQFYAGASPVYPIVAGHATNSYEEEERRQDDITPTNGEIERVDTVPFTWTHSAGSVDEDDEADYGSNTVTQGEINGNVDVYESYNEANVAVASAIGSTAPTSRRPQQSAFDRALTEIQQQGGSDERSRSNSYSLPETTGNAVRVAASSDIPKDDAPPTSSDDKVHDNVTAHTDDYLAVAEHNVLDEILSENPSDDVDMVSEKAHGFESYRQSSSSITDVADNRRNPDSQGRERFSLQTNINIPGRSSNSGTSASSSIRTKPADIALHKLPNVLSSVRQKIESFTDMSNVGSKSSSSGMHGDYPYYPPSILSSSTNIPSNHPDSMMMIDTSSASTVLDKYYKDEEERENMRRTFQQSISAAVLVSLAHKRYERRRLAAMEIEKVIRSLVAQEDYAKVRAILLLLSDDYVRSTNEDARKGGAVALAACAIGLKKANEGRDVMECRDLILASVVHACQDHSQRVRYYATESLFNVTKVIPSLAVQHFFILFEILRSLYADVDLDVRSGAELLDKKLKEVIVGAINSGSFSADACVPVFARFVYMRNKATKQLTLTWLQEFSDKLIGAPILEFLHLFLGGIFAMVSDPNTTIRQLALEFLQSVLPKLLVNNEDFEDAHHMAIDFDKILQSLVLTMEHPDPFVRKVAMYWMSRIVQAHISSAFSKSAWSDADEIMGGVESVKRSRGIDIISGPDGERSTNTPTAASISVRNALPHVLPGILLSIGDTYQSRVKDSFLPDHTTHLLAEQANSCLQDAVRRDGHAFIPHLGGFIVALRDELDSPGGLIARNPPSVERRPYRMDVKPDGSGIESTGWYRASDGIEERDNSLILSRLCALQWLVVLYEYVVPNSLKAEYASEFVDCIIYQLVDHPPAIITVKSFEVLAKISIPAEGEASRSVFAPSFLPQGNDVDVKIPSMLNPMDDQNANFALGVLDLPRRKLISRDRDVFASLIDLHSKNPKLLMDVSKVIELMCTLQPPEFVFVAFANELENFIVSRMKRREKVLERPEIDAQTAKKELAVIAKDLAFVSNFAQQLGIVFFAAPETEQLREVLKDSIGRKGNGVRDERRARLFYILFYAFSHNVVAALSLSLWGGAFLTASTFLKKIDPLDVSLMFYLEIDQLIDLIERPIFRHLHLRLLECEDDPYNEGSGAMLFLTLKRVLMLLPQSTSYMILQERLLSVARYRQSAVALNAVSKHVEIGSVTDIFVKRVLTARKIHVWAKWRMIRAESLQEVPCRIVTDEQKFNTQQQRREWLGYANEEDEKPQSKKSRVVNLVMQQRGQSWLVCMRD